MVKIKFSQLWLIFSIMSLNINPGYYLSSNEYQKQTIRFLMHLKYIIWIGKYKYDKKKFLCMFQYANNANECIFNVAVLRFPSIQFTKEKEKYISIILVQLLCVSSTKKCNNLSCI